MNETHDQETLREAANLIRSPGNNYPAEFVVGKRYAEENGIRPGRYQLQADGDYELIDDWSEYGPEVCQDCRGVGRLKMGWQGSRKCSRCAGSGKEPTV